MLSRMPFVNGSIELLWWLALSDRYVAALTTVATSATIGIGTSRFDTALSPLKVRKWLNVYLSAKPVCYGYGLLMVVLLYENTLGLI